MRFNLTLAVLSVALLATVVRAEEQPQKPTTMLEQYFKGDEKKLDDAIKSLFNRFDPTKDGVLSQDDLTRWMEKYRRIPFVGNRTGAEAAVRAQFNALDTSKDGNVTLEEFATVLKDQAKIPYTPQPELCYKVHKITDEGDVEDALESMKIRVKVFEMICKSNVPAIANYPLENCVLRNSNDTEAIKACYADSVNMEQPSVLLAKRHNHLVKRSWKGWFWFSMIILGIFSFGTLITIPFYIIVLVVATKAIDFDRMNY